MLLTHIPARYCPKCFICTDPSDPPQSHDVGSVILLILQMRVLRLRKRITCQGPPGAELGHGPRLPGS